jgi:hypothetical protein
VNLFDVRFAGLVPTRLIELPEFCNQIVSFSPDPLSQTACVVKSKAVSVVGQFELTLYLPETSAMKSATKRWISAGGRL